MNSDTSEFGILPNIISDKSRIPIVRVDGNVPVFIGEDKILIGTQETSGLPKE